MKTIYTTIITTLLCGILSCCSAVRTASLGAGAYAGKDYVTGLRPSTAARQYFTSMNPNAPVEMVSRGGTGSRSGVRYVDNDGILIPSGVTISFSNKGYCMDPHLPAPKAGDEYQLIPSSSMIPSSLQYTYQTLVKRAAAGDANVRGNMQGLVWALRTAGTPNSHAARLTASQKRILDSCSARPGDFERIHQNGLLMNKALNAAWDMANNALQVKVGGRTWKPGDFSSPAAFNSAVDSQLNSLIALGNKLPVQHTGFNYGELEPGIYTDIRGDGTLSFTAKIANNSGKDFIFYPCNYVGQVGNGSALSAVAFGATAGGDKKQHVSMGPVNQVSVQGEPEKQTETQQSDRLIHYNDLPCAEKRKYFDIGRMANLAYLQDDDSFMAKDVIQMRNEGYRLIDANFKSTGLHYVVMEGRDGTIYVAFRGTKVMSGDVADDADIYYNGHPSGKMVIATMKVRELMKQYQDRKIVLTGHSYGGSMVQQALAQIESPRLEGYVFNSYCLPDEKSSAKDNRLTELFHPDDEVKNVNLNSRLIGKKRILIGYHSLLVETSKMAKMASGNSLVPTMIYASLYASTAANAHRMSLLIKEMENELCSN